MQVLTQQLWPVLGIPPPVHTALQVWILFRQATLCGEPSLLEGAKKLLAASLSAPKAQHSLMDDCPGDEADVTGREFAEDVGEAIADWVCTRLSDYVAEMPEGGESLDSMLQVLVVLHQSMGQMDALPDVSAPATCMFAMQRGPG